MVTRGYAGRYLDIDLTRGEVTDYPIPEEWYRLLIGGKGFGSRILLEELRPEIDPLSPHNIMVINTGPFTGTGFPCSSRFNVSTKSPLTLAIASSSCGGAFGHHLKRAGADGLVIRGRAGAPVYIHVEDGRAEIHDASGLWGLDTRETQESLPGAAKAVIGPAGENRVLYASIISGERAAGRCGVGAVMGSKNLKGVVASGSAGPSVADPEGYREGIKRLLSQVRKHYITGEEGALKEYGTAMLLARTNASNTLPTRNFQAGTFEDAHLIDGEAMADTILVRNSGCLTCPIRCERVVRLGGELVKGPEYETLGLMGANLGISDLEAIAEWNHTCDLLGMDTMSTGGTLGFVMELTERGLLDSGLRFGSTDNVSETLKDIAYRRGLGNDLADGTWRMSERYGGEQFAIHVRGLEMAAYEPRGAVGHGLGYAVANRGACHINNGHLVFLEAWGPLTIDPLTARSKPELVALLQPAVDAWSSLGLCAFLAFSLLPGSELKDATGPGATVIAKSIVLCGPLLRPVLRRPRMLNHIPVPFEIFPYLDLLDRLTGMGIGLGDFIEAGQRINMQERLFNLGAGRAGAGVDTLPARLTTIPQTSNPCTCVPLADMRPEAYRLLGLNPDGTPTPAVLKRLSLEGV